MSYNDILQIAISTAHEAGAVIRKAFPRTALTHIGFKGEVNPVTETDTASEAIIVARLREFFPDHRILAEESGGDDYRLPGPPIWLIDPLDGTNNFAHGFPLVCISLALVEDGEPVVGVVHDPLRGETFAATAGGGAFLNGQPMHVSPVETLDRAFLATGFPYDRRVAEDNNVARLDRVVRHSLGVRRGGAAALDLAYVAAGRFDGFWEIRLKPWDVAAGIILVREAGGQATDFTGGPDCLSGEYIVATNGHIHEEILQHIKLGG